MTTETIQYTYQNGLEYITTTTDKNGNPHVSYSNYTILLLLTDIPACYRDTGLLIIDIDEDTFKVFHDDVLIREINPFLTRRLKCYFEEDTFIEFTREELNIIFGEMQRVNQ